MFTLSSAHLYIILHRTLNDIELCLHQAVLVYTLYYRGIYLWGRDEGHVKGDSLQCNTVVSATDNCWPVCMHSRMGVHSEKWPWPE